VRRLFGVETEYAVAALDDTGAVLPRGRLSEGMLRGAPKTFPALRATVEAGVFLGNGSRLYCDIGDHPELAGPECENPWDVVRYLRAGDRMLLRLTEDVRRRRPSIAQARVFAGNVDYAGTRSTWGAHESYCHRADPAVLRRRLVPHLVSRVIYAGAGGFNPYGPGLEFTLSPRSLHLRQVVSDSSTHERGIVHTRNQPLAAGGYRREHVLCGESLRSDLAAWLKVGVTALVVAMIDGGVACGDEVELEAPVEALHAFAKDVECRAGVPARRGGAITAIGIQRRYLHHAQRCLDAPFMPSWAREACERWGEILDRLEAGPDRVSRTLDWGIKLAMYRDRVERRGFEWSELAGWSAPMAALERARLARRRTSDDDPLVPETQRPADAELWLKDATGGARARLKEFIALRHELLEIDTRWALLGPGGVFDALDRAGVLDCGAGVDGIEEAVDQPPSGSRARVRGMAIRRLARAGERYSAGWDHVFDQETGRRLDLSDPFVQTERWREPQPAPPPPPAPAVAPPEEELTPPRGAEGLWESVSRALSRLGL